MISTADRPWEAKAELHPLNPDKLVAKPYVSYQVVERDLLSTILHLSMLGYDLNKLKKVKLGPNSLVRIGQHTMSWFPYGLEVFEADTPVVIVARKEDCMMAAFMSLPGVEDPDAIMPLSKEISLWQGCRLCGGRPSIRFRDAAARRIHRALNGTAGDLNALYAGLQSLLSPELFMGQVEQISEMVAHILNGTIPTKLDRLLVAGLLRAKSYESRQIPLTPISFGDEDEYVEAIRQ